MPLQIVQVRNDLLSKLGIEDAADATTQDLQDVVVAINGAMQILQTAGQDYFTRELLTVTMAAGTSLYTITKNVQAVLGPIRWNDEKPLRGLESQGQIDQFERIFLGQSEYGVGSGDPRAYWVKYLRDGTTGDICQMQIRVAPAPTSPAGTLTVEVVNDAPAYDTTDLTSTSDIPVAQNYTESIFLPLARMLVTRSSKFSRPDLLPRLTADYQTAMQRLGYAGGFPNAAQPAAPRETEG